MKSTRRNRLLIGYRVIDPKGHVELEAWIDTERDAVRITTFGRGMEPSRTTTLTIAEHLAEARRIHADALATPTR